ncbi:MAG: hypothetical protein IJ927_01790 [Eubacterium sp.]|jgi:hypothetical protein|nr:hypothetical protein [Eubacterium sp.]
MKKKFEYNEPEFMVVISGNEDVIRTSGEIPEGSLGRVTDDWENPEVSIEI